MTMFAFRKDFWPPVENAGMPKTAAERQEERRKRLLMDGITEVRGIFLHESQHAELKEYAKKLAKRHSRKSPAGTTDPSC